MVLQPAEARAGVGAEPGVPAAGWMAGGAESGVPAGGVGEP